jgi:Holliday junction resolvase RusA-like endonuclease
MKEITLHVPAIPVAQPRQRHAKIAGFSRNYTPAKHPVNAYKATVRMAWQQTERGGWQPGGALEVWLVFVLPRPKTMCWKKRPTPRAVHVKTPDVDNLTKSTLDALKGLAWNDDSQICMLKVGKFIAAGNEEPHVEILIREVTDG